jgi:hypothetical protein
MCGMFGRKREITLVDAGVDGRVILKIDIKSIVLGFGVVHLA